MGCDGGLNACQTVLITRPSLIADKPTVRLHVDGIPNASHRPTRILPNSTHQQAKVGSLLCVQTTCSAEVSTYMVTQLPSRAKMSEPNIPLPVTWHSLYRLNGPQVCSSD
jgi:hypothetical protein